MSRTPNLFVIGAPRCGTTSLFRWLTDHADVCTSSVKEPRFFMDPRVPQSGSQPTIHTADLETYRKYFDRCGGDSKIVMEATPHYLFQETALQYLSGMDPLPRIVVSLREPVDRLFSHFCFSQEKGRLSADISFEHFVDILISGATEKLARYIHDPFFLYVLSEQISISSYYRWLINWKQRFPANRLKILIFEEMIGKPNSVMQDLSSWIGIDPEYYATYDCAVRNPTAEHFSSTPVARLAGSVRYIPGGVKKLLSPLKKQYKERRRKKRYAIQASVLKRLAPVFEESNELLSTELDLDISSWYDFQRVRS